jgi:hypothetical protein
VDKHSKRYNPNEEESMAKSVDRVSALYKKIRTLENKKRTPAEQTKYLGLITKLRKLQKAEARKLDKYFQKHALVKKGSADDAIKQADRLLARVEKETNEEKWIRASIEKAKKRAIRKAGGRKAWLRKIDRLARKIYKEETIKH